jgi:hypothetical protein
MVVDLPSQVDIHDFQSPLVSDLSLRLLPFLSTYSHRIFATHGELHFLLNQIAPSLFHSASPFYMGRGPMSLTQLHLLSTGAPDLPCANITPF